MSFAAIALTIALDALGFASYLFLVAAGLSLIFGVMKIVNVAHGSVYAWGAYVASFGIAAWTRAGLPAWGTFAVIAAAGLATGAVVGLGLFAGLGRFTRTKDDGVVMLATFAAFLILEDVLLLMFGSAGRNAAEPVQLLGSIDIAGSGRDVYGLLLILIASTIGFALWWGLAHTHFGLLTRVVMFNEEAAAAQGINVLRVRRFVFLLGSILGALAGALVAPTVSVAPGFSVDVIVMAFAVVVIGGLGSIPGAAAGAALVGIVRALAVHVRPELELFVVYAVMVGVLAFRPAGLFAPVEPRKI